LLHVGKDNQVLVLEIKTKLRCTLSHLLDVVPEPPLQIINGVAVRSELGFQEKLDGVEIEVGQRSVWMRRPELSCAQCASGLMIRMTIVIKANGGRSIFTVVSHRPSKPKVWLSQVLKATANRRGT
jgi:hypothetical protein